MGLARLQRNGVVTLTNTRITPTSFRVALRKAMREASFRLDPAARGDQEPNIQDRS